jgi:hypothetical protein
MFVKWTRLLSLVFLLVGVGALAAGAPATSRPEPQLPVRSIDVTVGKGAREKFFDRLRTFADAHAFAIRIAPTTPDRENFLVQMWREDIKIVAVTSLRPETFHIGFYRNDTEAAATAAYDVLVTDLRHAVSEIEGSTFSETK